MGDKINVRKIEPGDYEFIDKWWVEQGFEPLNRDILPMDGLGGIIIEKEKPIAAGFIYLTNSNIGYVDYVISDPNYKGKDRYKIILQLIENCLHHAISLGCESVFATSRSNGIIKRCKELGYNVTTKDYGIIVYNKI